MGHLTPSEVALLELVRCGDTRAFDDLVAPYRHELLVYCYRLLGAIHDAEDTVQETLLRAWKQIHTFQHMRSFRAWLYKIATNVCLTALARSNRQPSIAIGASQEPRPIEPSWIEPLPDDLLADVEANPEAIYSLRESVALAFVVALQVLPPRQRAAVILHDVLGWHAAEIALFLNTTTSAVNSTLHRARASLSANYDTVRMVDTALPSDPGVQTLLRRYVRAWEDADVESLAAILRDDALFTMPPGSSWYQGREAICVFVRDHLFRGAGAGFGRLVPVRANAQPAYALYRLEPLSNLYRAYGISVLTISGGAVAAITTFLGAGLFPRFRVPLELQP